MNFLFKNKQTCIIMKTEDNKHKNKKTEDFGWYRINGIKKQLLK